MMAVLGWARREYEGALRDETDQNVHLGVQTAQVADDTAPDVSAFSATVQVSAAPSALLAATAADTTAPTVGVTGPTGGASGTVILTATPAAGVEVAGVQFLVNGTPLGAEVTLAPYTLTVNTTAAENGTYTLAARARDAAGNTTTTAPVTVTVTNDPAPGAPPPSSSVLFVGDYDTGDFTQWLGIQNKSANGTARSWPATGSYPAQIVYDAERGAVARYEVRSGDRPSGDRTNVNRSEVLGDPAKTGGSEGQLRSYEFSVKFDPTFPAETGSWGVLTNQWHSNAPVSPPLAFYAAGDQWELRADRYASPTEWLDEPVLWRTPVKPGEWHDIRMVVMWSTSDNIGYVELWHNGVRQQFTDGSYTYRTRTLVPLVANSSTYYKEGIYRPALSNTAIVYHDGFRSSAVSAASSV